MQKRMCVKVFVVVLALGFIFGSAASASDDVVLEAPEVSGNVGDRIEVAISIDNAAGTTGGQLNVFFDPDIVAPVEGAGGTAKTTSGDFMEGATGAMIMGSVKGDHVGLVWATPVGSEKDSGVLVKYEFDLLEVGTTTLVIDGSDDMAMMVSPGKTVSTVEGSIEVLPDPKDVAIDAAIDAIDDLPAVEDLTLDDKDAVEAARALVEDAKDLGATDADITNLDDLEAAEARIAELEDEAAEAAKQEAIDAAIAAIAALIAAEDMTLDDKDAVLNARALVDEAIALGADLADIENLDDLTAAEERIADLEDDEDEELPPTAGTALFIIAGLLLVLTGATILVRRKQLN